MKLNQSAAGLCQEVIGAADRLRVAVFRNPCGCRIIDCGINVPGGLEAGRLLSEISMAGLGRVSFAAGTAESWRMPGLTTCTDHPVAACLASQYAGWQIALEGCYALASGPMRAMAAKEALFESIGHWEAGQAAIGVLETRQLPSTEMCRHVARQCRLDPEQLTLLVAPTASQAGTIQVIARTVEMAVRRLYEVGFDLDRLESGFGTAPLPPVGATDLAAMARTYDAILYGSEVTLWVRGDEESLGAIGPRLTSSASDEHGQPFAGVFDHHGRDLYSIDPSLFAPAVVALFNLDTGRSFRFGRVMPEILQESFTL